MPLNPDPLKAPAHPDSRTQPVPSSTFPEGSHPVSPHSGPAPGGNLAPVEDERYLPPGVIVRPREAHSENEESWERIVEAAGGGGPTPEREAGGSDDPTVRKARRGIGRTKNLSGR